MIARRRRRAFQVLVAFLALLAAPSASPSPSSSSSSDCPPGCTCKWISGKETALCTQLGLTGVPVGAAQGTQVIFAFLYEILRWVKL